jgi:enediyne biosynthesis protein E4
MRREISVGGGHVSGGNGWWHFGLADNTKTQLRVQWPDGTMGAWQNVDADQFYTIAKEGDVKIWPLP